MGFFAHAQTVDTRPLFPPTTWPGYEAIVLQATIAVVEDWVQGSLVPRLSVGGEGESLVHTVCACV